MSVERSELSVERSAPRGAVFVSYASQDAGAARRICDTLRASGVEVWFDADGGLEHGDEWDAKIRRQIKECVLFIPVISANTQARHEGYFRIEWDLAAERARGIAGGVAFILPVVIDDTREPEALVPDRFRAVQWTRLPGGVVTPDVKARYVKLWSQRAAALKAGIPAGREGPGAEWMAGAPASRPAGDAPAALPPRAQRIRWLARVGLALATAAVLIVIAQKFWPRRNGAAVSRAEKSFALSPELAAIRARIVPDRWTNEDYQVLRAELDRILQVQTQNADAWALRSYIASMQVIRTLDHGTKVLLEGKADAERALRIAPGSPLAELALGLHGVAMTARGGDAEAARPHIERGVAGLPADGMTRYAEMGYFAFSLQLEQVRSAADVWLREEPTATFPLWCRSLASLVERRAEEAIVWAERGVAGGESATGVRSLFTIFEANFFLRADLAAARRALERVPASARSHHRLVYGRWLLALAEGNFDDAIQELTAVADKILSDRCFHGPKALLAGIAHRLAGRAAPAAAQFREAERALRELLAADPDAEDLRLALALTLAYGGRSDDARSELGAVEPVLRRRKAYLYSGHAHALLAETYSVLGDVPAMLPWLRLLLAGPSAVPYTPASFRRDPRYGRVAGDPELIARLREFEPRDTGKAAVVDKSVVVLPFENLSDDRSEYLSDGIPDELLTTLQKIPGLRVAARPSAFSFKGKNATVREVGEKLGMTHVVEGSVQKLRNQVKITARLSRAATNEELWSHSYGPLELTDAFGIQTEIAQAIVAELRGQLAGEGGAAIDSEIRAQVAAAQQGGTRDATAHELYLQAVYFLNLNQVEAAERAAALLRRALDRDSQFALGWVALSQCGWVRAGFGETKRDFDEGVALAREAAEHALAIAPKLAAAHLARGVAAMTGGFDWPVVRASLQRAQELAPGDPTVMARAAWVAGIRAADERAITLYRTAIALDPVNPLLRMFFANVLHAAGRLDEAMMEFRRVAELSPSAPWGHAGVSILLVAQGRPAEAIAEAEREATMWCRLFALAVAYGNHDPAKSDAALAALIDGYADVAAVQVAWVYAYRHDNDRAFEWLERAYRQHDGGLQLTRGYPLLRSLQGDPRWQPFLRKIGLAEEQWK